MRYGRIGTKGQERTKKHADEDAAAEAVKRLIASKEKKGYRELAPAVDWRGATPQWRPPPALADVGVDEIEQQVLALRREAPHSDGWSAAKRWFAQKRLPAIAARLRDELTADALDLGASHAPQGRGATTPAAERRREREAQDLYAQRYVREHYLKAVMELLAGQCDSAGTDRLLELVEDGGPPFRGWAAEALTKADVHLSDEHLERWLALLESPDDARDYGGVIAEMTRVLLRQRPDAAFEQLREYLRARAVKTAAGRMRAGGILSGVGRRSPPISADWAKLVFPLHRHATLASRVFESLVALPDDETSVPRLIKWLEKRSTGALQTDARALALLGEVGTPRALPILTRALLENAPYRVCLEGLMRIEHDEAAAAVAEYLHRLREVQGITAGDQVDLAERVLAHLAERGFKPPSTPATSEAEERFPKRDRTKKRRAPKVPRVPSLAKQRASLVEELRAVGLEHHAALLIEPSIRFVAARDISKSFAVGASKLGGVPDLPADVEWPHHEGRPLAFVGQIDLAEVAGLDLDHVLPDSGLLSFFVMDLLGPYDTDHYLQVGRVLHFEPDRDLARAGSRIPELIDPFLPCRLHFHSLLKLRSPSHPRTTSDLTGPEQERYDAIWATVDPTHQLLGPRDCRWEAERDPDDVLLYQCVSDPHPDAAWGDNDDLYFYIPAKALRQRDFNAAFVHCGE